ncbi:MAG: glycosyltransferase family 39 protein [Chloroflexota bacterium]
MDEEERQNGLFDRATGRLLETATHSPRVWLSARTPLSRLVSWGRGALSSEAPSRRARAAFLLVSTLLVVLPGDRTALLPGLPLNIQIAGPALVLAGVISLCGKPGRWACVALGTLAVIKLAVVPLVIKHGLVGTYYASANLSGPVEQVRLDRQINFSDDTFPLAFFNQAQFNFTNPPIDRDQLPFSVRWTGQIVGGPIHVTGDHRFFVNGSSIVFEKGWSPHARISLSGASALYPVDYTRGQIAVGDIARWADDAVAVIGALVLLPLLAGVRLGWAGATFLIMAGQGLYQAGFLVGKTPIFAAGQDWLRYEGEARDVLAHGWLMNGGAALFAGQPFYHQAFYSYFVALEHLVTGSGVAGITFGNYLLLAATVVLLMLLTRDLFGMFPGLICLFLGAWFAEKYLVASAGLLMSENLAYPLLAGGFYFFIRSWQRHETGSLLASALLLGLAADTRSTVVLASFGPVVWLLWQRRWQATTLFIAFFAMPLALVVLRNFLVSGQPALLPSYGFFNIRLTHPVPAGVRYTVPAGADADRAAVLAYIRQRPLEFIGQSFAQAARMFGLPPRGGDVLANLGLSALWVLWLGCLIFVRKARASLGALVLNLFVVQQVGAVLLFGLFIEYGVRVATLALLCLLPFAAAALAQLARLAQNPSWLPPLLAVAIPLSSINLPAGPTLVAAAAIGAPNRDIRIVSAQLPAQAAPGQTVALGIHWLVLNTPHAAYMLYYRVIDMAGRLAFAGEAPPWPLGAAANPWDNTQPTATWTTGEQFDGNYHVAIPTGLAPGMYSLQVGLYSRRPNIVLEDGRLSLPLSIGHAQIGPPVTFRSIPRAAERPLAMFGSVELESIHASPTGVTLTWKDRRPMDSDYSVFVHALASDGHVVAQNDSAPASGAWPTSSWVRGDVIVDRHSLPLPPSTALLEVGLYDPRTGQRLQTLTGTSAFREDIAGIWMSPTSSVTRKHQYAAVVVR